MDDSGHVYENKILYLFGHWGEESKNTHLVEKVLYFPLKFR